MMEFTQLLSQVILPIALALMMFAMGLSLTTADFKRVVEYPKAFWLGISMQLVLLPLLAWGLLSLFGMLTTVPVLVASGIIILAACPGGATSNIISHLSGGNGALSISMTAVVSLVVPFILPFSLGWQLSLLGGDSGPDQALQLPIVKTLMQLLVVTVVPVVGAMWLRHKYSDWVLKHEPKVHRFSSLLFIALVLSLMISNWPKLMMGWLVGALSLSLCVLVMVLASSASRLMKFDERTQITLMVETGIQNAGTGIFIAAALLGNPQLALIPLVYGLLMNIPAVMLILYGKSRQLDTPMPT